MDRLDLEATRGDVWAPTIEYSYAGALPAGTWRLQWRLYEGAAGAAIVDIAECPFLDIPAPAEDLASGFARPGDRVLRLMPNIIIPADLPTGRNQPEAGEADRYVWDATCTVDGKIVLRPIGGDIIVNKGVSRP